MSLLSEENKNISVAPNSLTVEKVNKPALQMEEQKESDHVEIDGKALASFLVGIASLVFVWVPIIPYITAIIGIVFGFLSINSTNRGFSVTGIILSIVTLLLKVAFWFLIWFAFMLELS